VDPPHPLHNQPWRLTTAPGVRGQWVKDRASIIGGGAPRLTPEMDHCGRRRPPDNQSHAALSVQATTAIGRRRRSMSSSILFCRVTGSNSVEGSRVISEDLAPKLVGERDQPVGLGQKLLLAFADDRLEEPLQSGRRDQGQHTRWIVADSSSGVRYAPWDQDEGAGLSDCLCAVRPYCYRGCAPARRGMWWSASGFRAGSRRDPRSVWPTATTRYA
jgi:hypothetical protein